MNFQEEYNLIIWCTQYLTKDKNFIDIGMKSANFTMLLSQYCKYVYCYEKLNNNLNNVNTIINSLNLNNVLLCSNTLKLNAFDNVGLIKIFNQSYEDCCFLLKDLKLINYPPIVCDNQEYKIQLKLLSYDIFDLNGYPGIYYAGNNTNNNNVSQKKYEEIIFDNNSNATEINNALLNEYDYMKAIKYTDKILLNCPMKLTRVPNNPSIIKIGNNYMCNIRASNYKYDPNFTFLDADNIHRSDHYILTFDHNFMVKSTIMLVDKTNNLYFNSFVEGVDDLRLINETTFICSHGNFNNKRLIQQCLGTFDSFGNITKLILLKGPVDYRHEKNWLPYEKDEKLYVIYMIHPFTVYEVNTHTGDLILVNKTLLTDKNCNNFRGSAPCIIYNNIFGNGWLATIHQVCSSTLSYIHRFVWFNEDFTIMKVSLPFYFEHKGIEFNPGMCHNHNNTGIILSHSVLDNNARCIMIDYNTIDEYFND